VRRSWASLLALALVGALVAMLAVDPGRWADWVGIAAVAALAVVVISLHVVVHEARAPARRAADRTPDRRRPSGWRPPSPP